MAYQAVSRYDLEINHVWFINEWVQAISSIKPIIDNVVI